MSRSWKCLHLCYSEFPARATVFLTDVSPEGLRCVPYAHYSSFIRITCRYVEGWADPRLLLRTWCMKKECSGLSKTRNMIVGTSKWLRLRASHSLYHPPGLGLLVPRSLCAWSFMFLRNLMFPLVNFVWFSFCLTLYPCMLTLSLCIIYSTNFISFLSWK